MGYTYKTIRNILLSTSWYQKIHQRLITYVNGSFDTLHKIIFSLRTHLHSAAIFFFFVVVVEGFQVIFLFSDCKFAVTSAHKHKANRIMKPFQQHQAVFIFGCGGWIWTYDIRVMRFLKVVLFWSIQCRKLRIYAACGTVNFIWYCQTI